jgi:hypothetical protein
MGTQTIFKLSWVFFLLLMALVAITLLIPKAKAQGFTVENRMHGGISVPQRTEQPNIGKEGLASTGWSAGTTFYFESSKFDGGPTIGITYGDYNAEAQIGLTRLQLLRVEIGAFTHFRIIGAEIVIISGGFGKSFSFSPFSGNGFGGSVGFAYEAARAYGVYARYSYYNLGIRTVGLLEAGVQARIF